MFSVSGHLIFSNYTSLRLADLLTSLHFQAGAGIWPLSSAFMASDSPSSSPNSSSVPLYENCAFVTSGRGQFRPTAAANPHSGRPGETEHLDEQRVEMMIGDSEEQNGEQVMRRVVARLRAVHPYEVVAMAVVRIEDV